MFKSGDRVVCIERFNGLLYGSLSGNILGPSMDPIPDEGSIYTVRKVVHEGRDIFLGEIASSKPYKASKFRKVQTTDFLFEDIEEVLQLEKETKD
jgi:hypothetical protein